MTEGNLNDIWESFLESLIDWLVSIKQVCAVEGCMKWIERYAVRVHKVRGRVGWSVLAVCDAHTEYLYANDFKGTAKFQVVRQGAAITDVITLSQGR